MFIGQDLRISGQSLASFQITTDEGKIEHILALQKGCVMTIGANRLSAERAVFWLETEEADFRGNARYFYHVRAYLEGKIEIETEEDGAPKASDLENTEPEAGLALIVRFTVAGEIFVSADEREVADVRGLRLYARAIAAARQKHPEERARRVRTGGATKIVEQPVEGKEPRYRYPINLAKAGEVGPKFEWDQAADGTDIATVIGRFYIWQKVDDEGHILELEADNAVIFHSSELFSEAADNNGDLLARGVVEAVYLSGDVVMREGQRTVRADELLYDFDYQKALAINADMRTYDTKRGIPIYVRAKKLRQLTEDQFIGEDVVVTTSEFHTPQMSFEVAKIAVTDMTPRNEAGEPLGDASYDALMEDTRFKIGKTTVFKLDRVRSDLERPDTPIRKVRGGYGGRWGASAETEWYLARILGLKEPEGTESTLSADYYSKRGLGGGVTAVYTKENYFGNLLGYVIDDHGEDRLGRIPSRKHLEPPRDLRGRFQWQHRHFLPYDWQFTSEVSYLSDQNFLEQYYRGEFNVGKEEETLVHMKRIQDNWGLSLLGKARLNDFNNKLEELPTAEFHWTGQSLGNNMFTLYNDTQVSNYRQRIGNENMIAMDQQNFTFISHRTELDMPLNWGGMKVVPYGAQSFGMDDRSGFTRTRVNGMNAGTIGDERVWVGEVGVRAAARPLWKVYPNAYSRLWDINQLRHIIRPRAAAVMYKESDSAVEQKDTLNVGLTQILQTKRGPVGEQKTVDWMRLDADAVWVSDSEKAGTSGPDRFLWATPFIPFRVMAAPRIFNGDLMPSLQRFETYGPKRNYFSTDFIWRVSETTAFLSDAYYDMQSGVVQQINLGAAVLRSPNLSYYVGARYLKRTNILGEKGTNAVTFAATYVLDPRYTVVFSNQYDFDYSHGIRSDITLIRKYHRLYMGLTFSSDSTLDTSAVVLSFWPEGVPELALGPRRYMDLGSGAGY